jgi:hypothetical protein
MTSISKVNAPGGSPLGPAISVYTDGETITGNGTQADPLVASGSNTVTIASSASPGDIVLGSPLTLSGLGFGARLAQGDTQAHASVVGLALTANADVGGAEVTYQYQGIVTLTVAQWQAVTVGGAGLVAGNAYFLSSATAGLITNSVPLSDQLALIGYALSTTELQLQLSFPQAA